MSQSVVPINNSIIQPIPSLNSQLNGRNIAHLQQPAPAVLLNALDRARLDHNEMQRRLENQVQEREVALFQAVHQNANLTDQLNVAVRQVEEERGRVNELEGQLAAERQLKITLRNQLRTLQDQANVMRGEAENAQRLRNDIQRRLDETDVRMGVLEQQIVSERARTRRENRLNELRVQKFQLERDIEQLATPQITGVISSTIGGAAIGGIFGALAGLATSIVVGIFSPCAKEEGVCRTKLWRIENELKQLEGENGQPQ